MPSLVGSEMCIRDRAQLMPLPLTVSCFSKIQIGFTFLLSAHPGTPGQRAEENGCVCVCALPVTQPKASKHYTHLGSMGKTIYIYIFADIFSSFLTSQKKRPPFLFFFEYFSQNQPVYLQLCCTHKVEFCVSESQLGRFCNNWLYKMHPMFEGSNGNLTRCTRSAFHKVHW